MHFQDSLVNKKNSIYLKGIFCSIINVIYCIYYYYFLKGTVVYVIHSNMYEITFI